MENAGEFVNSPRPLGLRTGVQRSLAIRHTGRATQGLAPES